MIALLLCGLIAGACAAPSFENFFDTRKFKNDLSKKLEHVRADFSRHFPTRESQERVEGNEYKIIISLPDFDEKDIVVKVRNASLKIQANHRFTNGSKWSYQDVRTLPDTVNVTGNWIYEKGVLKITFPLKDGAVVKPTEPITTTEQQSQFNTTVRPHFAGNREEIETTNANEGVQNADVRFGRGDLDKESQLKPNEIPDRNTVKATTHAVDLEDGIGFVSIRY